MHGAGNSFIILEDIRGGLAGGDLSVLARRLCDPASGPGADGMIVVVPDAEADFGMLFYNSDGSTGEMCGNGARCVSRYAVEHGISADPEDIRFRAPAGLVRGRRIDGELYEVRLNDPSVVELRREAQTGSGAELCSYVELGSPGIPHAVVEVGPAELWDPDSLRERGRALRRSPSFPRGANVTFVCVTGQHSIRAVTYERGVEDFTLACGTGCGAAAVALLLGGRLPPGILEVEMPGGRLSVRLSVEDGAARDIYLTGPTALVCEGELG